MKKFLTIASMTVILFMTACNNSGESGTASTSMSAGGNGDKNIATVHSVNDAIESGDVNKLDQYIATDAVDHSGDHGEVKGLDSIKASLKTMHDDYKDLKLTSLQDAAGGDYVFSLTNFKGTNVVASMGAPAGTNFDMSSVEVVKFNKDGKISDHWSYMSMSDAMKMMGGSHMDMPMKKDTAMKKM
jgi:predicted ester cyclase